MKWTGRRAIQRGGTRERENGEEVGGFASVPVLDSAHSALYRAVNILHKFWLLSRVGDVYFLAERVHDCMNKVVLSSCKRGEEDLQIDTSTGFSFVTS